jgi:hypothetical protein
MTDESAAGPERDPRFPGGAWTGFFLQHWVPGRNKMDLHLEWQGGEISGRGRDRVGAFTITGTYGAAAGKVEWTKKYAGKHSVSYRGVNDGRGVWGVWEIRQLGGLYHDRGGFHIWPEGSDVSEESDATEKAVLEAMRAEFGDRVSPLHPALLAALVAVAFAFVMLVMRLFSQ